MCTGTFGAELDVPRRIDVCNNPNLRSTNPTDYFCTQPEYRDYYGGVLEAWKTFDVLPSDMLGRAMSAALAELPDKPSLTGSQGFRSMTRNCLPTQRGVEQCLVKTINAHTKLLRAIDAKLDADPQFVRWKEQRDSCKQNADVVLQQLCDWDDLQDLYASTKTLHADYQRLRPSSDDAVNRAFAELSTVVIARCKGDRQCLMTELGNVRARVRSGLIAATTTRYVCEYVRNGKTFTRLIALNTSGLAEMTEPPENPLGAPLERLAFVYYGRHTTDDSGIFAKFTMTRVTSRDPHAYALAIGQIPGSINLNDGRLDNGVVEHSVRLTSGPNPTGTLVLIKTGKPDVRLSLSCRPPAPGQ